MPFSTQATMADSASKLIERGRTSSAMSHAGRQKKAAPVADLLRPAVRRSHALVIPHRVERREQGIAQAMPEDKLAAMSRKCIELGPTPGFRNGRAGIGERPLDRLVHIHSDICERRPDRVSASLQ